MKCITLTLSPAFDRHCHVPQFTLYREHLATSDTLDAGGKGVNISRALCQNGVDSTAFVVMGRENADAFADALKADGLNFIPFVVDGRIRENFTIYSDGKETRVSFSGFECDDTLLDNVYGLLENEIDKETIITFTGRAPAGVSLNSIKHFLKALQNQGAKIVLDSKSFETLDDIIDVKPWLIKPNQEEISTYLGRDVNTHREILDIAREIHMRGVENVMVSLGEKGAMLVCSDGTYICTPPKTEVKSSIGAGDSSIGGFIAATILGLCAKDALCRAVAFGTAACMREGTLPPQKCDVENLMDKLQMTIL